MIHTQKISSAISAFLASLVEFVEALTIVLAVGVTRGWRPALSGTFAGTFLLIGLVALFGPALHDEAKTFDQESRTLRESPDAIAFITAFKAVVIEGLEVVFIVLATGSPTKSMMPAITGASAAGLLVVILGLIIHRPLTRVPENSLKFFVSVVLSAFGVFWIGESFNYAWPGDDLAIPALALGFFAVSRIAIQFIRRSRPASL
jgi:uncharacterized membrane protein